jgi:hypothetical protein
MAFLTFEEYSIRFQRIAGNFRLGGAFRRAAAGAWNTRQMLYNR